MQFKQNNNSYHSTYVTLSLTQHTWTVMLTLTSLLYYDCFHPAVNNLLEPFGYIVQS